MNNNYKTPTCRVVDATLEVGSQKALYRKEPLKKALSS